MGLYSTIKSNYKLPLPADLGELKPDLIQEAWFQSKDLDEDMQYYEISESGQLMLEHRDEEFVEGNPNGKTFAERFGHLKTLKSWFEPHKVTREVLFYTDFRCDEHKNDYWVEYKATFIDGQIKNLELFKFEATDNADRKARDAKWKAELAASHEFRKRWYIKYFYLPYERAIRWIFRTYNRLKQKLPPYYKVERFLTPF